MRELHHPGLSWFTVPGTDAEPSCGSEGDGCDLWVFGIVVVIGVPADGVFGLCGRGSRERRWRGSL